MSKITRYLRWGVLLCLFGFWEVSPVSAQFADRELITTQAQGVNSVLTADIDNDGDLDIFSTSLLDNKIAWYENVDGFGNFGGQQVISLAALKVNDVKVADIDLDGDLDLISASRDDNKIAWYQNFGGGAFGSQQVISTEAFVAQSVFAADLDGDGDQDVLSASRDDNKIAWYENTDGRGTFGPQIIISTDAIWAIRVVATDIDGDGDLDVLSASEQDDKIAWYENQDGAGTFSAEIVVSVTVDAVRDVKAVDIDLDGDVDILTASTFQDKITWFENTDGAGVFSAEKVVSTNADFPLSVDASDLDLDGDIDLLSASANDSKIAWYENTDGLAGTWKQHEVATDAFGAVVVSAANLDGDEDVDILTASSFNNTIYWYESFLGRGRVQFGAVNIIGGVFDSQAPHAVFGTDIDGDGDTDVLSASYNDNKIAWYPNIQGALGSQRIITVVADGARDVFAADIDGDGDMDALSASGYDNSIRWYENFDGQGSFDLIHLVSDNASNAYAVFAADIDGDGDQDILSASSSDDKIAWYENEDGLGGFGDQIIITKAAKGATDVLAADIDGDGDMDVASASTFDDKIAWYENTDGQGTFGDQRVISTNADLAIALHSVDMDGDGDVDLLSASSGDNKIAWYKNLDGAGTFSAEKIVSVVADRAFAVYTADLDNDGDQDVISGSRDDDKVAWYDNLGDERFSQEQIITTNAQGVRSVAAFDIDLDGDYDVLSASQDDNRIAWYENLSLEAHSLSADEDVIPESGFALSEAYPNPASVTVNFNLRLDQTQHVRVAVYDIQGRLLQVLHDGLVVHDQLKKIGMDTYGMPAGLYLVRFEGEYFQATRKSIVLR